MKKPIVREVSKTEYEREVHMEKVIGEQHFCPICDKPSVEYFDEYYKDGVSDVGEPEYKENSYTLLDTMSLVVILLPYDDVDYIDYDDDRRIHFTPEELGLDLEKYRERNKNFIKNYIKNFNIKEDHEPTFCSKKCAKKFIMENIFHQNSSGEDSIKEPER